MVTIELSTSIKAWCTLNKSNGGFTLIELLIAVVIIGILAVLVVPSYQDQIQRSRRYDATSTLMNIISAQEQYRANNLTYGTLATVWGGVTITPDGNYNLSITNNTATGYLLTATPVAGSDQVNDDEGAVNCGTLTVTANGLSVARTPAACW